MEIPLFEQIGEVARSLVSAELGEVKFRAHRRGVKMWFGPERPPRLHYEAQMIPSHFVAQKVGEDETAIEVGFHAEHGDERRNTAVIDHLISREKTWRRALGKQAQAGPFLGNEGWGRLSETWVEADLEDPDLAFELASRLADYIQTIEPILDKLPKASS